MRVLSAILTIFLLACGSSVDDVFDTDSSSSSSTTTSSTSSSSTTTTTATSTPATTTTTTTATTVASDPAPSSNPVASTQIFGENGNLYKPRSDETASGGGNMVVLLSSRFSTQFDSCEVKTNDGQTRQLTCVNDQPWTQIPYSCFSNGNRQTWRADFGCSSVAEVRVVCRESFQEVTFTVPASQRGNVCSRFG